MESVYAIFALENGIDIFFLSVIVLVFFIGLRLLFLQVESWKNEVSENSNWFGLGSINETYNFIISDSWKGIQSTSGILISIGLLGTFVGISFAIYEMGNVLADDTLTPNQQMDGLKSSLVKVSTQFKTSIWGIIASLIFRVCAGIKKNQADLLIKQKLQEAYSNQYSLNQNEKSERFKSINESLESIEKHLEGFQENAHLMKDAAIRMDNSFRQSTTVLSDSTQNFSKSASDFRSSVENFQTKMEKVMGTAEETFKGISIQIGNAITKLENTIETSFMAFQKDVKDTLSTVSSDLKMSTEAIKTAVDKSSLAIEGSLQNSTDKIDKATNNLSTKIGDGLKDISNKMEALNTQVKYLKDYYNKMQVVFVELEKMQREQMQHSKNIQKHVNESTGKSFEIADTLANVLKEEGVLDSNLKNLTELAEKRNLQLELLSTQKKRRPQNDKGQH